MRQKQYLSQLQFPQLLPQRSNQQRFLQRKRVKNDGLGPVAAENDSEQPEEDKNFDKPVIVATEQVREHPNSSYSEDDVDLIARTVYLESGGCGEYCQWLTASTILNLAESRGGVANVVYDYNTFNVADMIDYCSPSDLSYSVAERVISGDRDYNVKAFRADYYHDFGSPYTSADNVYFSTY